MCTHYSSGHCRCPEWTWCCLYCSGQPPESRDAWEELGILSSWWQKRALHRERQFGERLSLSSHRSWQLCLVPKVWREYPQLQLPIYYKHVNMLCCYSWESHYWIGESHFVHPTPLSCPLSCRVWPESCHPIHPFPVPTTSFGLPSRECHSGCPHPTLFGQVSCIPPLVTRIRSAGPIIAFPTLFSFGVASPFQ